MERMGSILAHSELMAQVEVLLGMQTGASPDADYFKAYVFGYSENMDVNSGELYGDNFGETGGIPLPPTELVVNEGTTGTEITITGADFGTKKGKVLLGPDGKTKAEDSKGRLD